MLWNHNLDLKLFLIQGFQLVYFYIEKFNTLQSQLREKIKTEKNNIRLEDEAKEKGIGVAIDKIINEIDELEDEL